MEVVDIYTELSIKSKPLRLTRESMYIQLFRFVLLGEPEPELAKLDRPGSSWSRVLVFCLT